MLARPLFGDLRKHWTGILLGILAISSTLYGLGRWESGQTLNGLSTWCVSAGLATPESTNPKYFHFEVTVGFRNPNWLPIDVYWVATPVLNGSAYFGGLLQDVIPPLSDHHLSKMVFSFIQPFVQPSATYVLNRVVSYERYSVLGDAFTDPRIFFITSERNTVFQQPNSVLNLTANNMASILYFTFIQHSNFRNDQDGLCAAYGT